VYGDSLRRIHLTLIFLNVYLVLVLRKYSSIFFNQTHVIHFIRFNPIAALYEEGYIWLLKGDLLFKFNEGPPGYELHETPQRINDRFPGVPKHVRSAFTHDRKHYFFTEPDQQVYVFDTKIRRLEPGYPKSMTTGWLACKEQ
jgi:hypothetical protein